MHETVFARRIIDEAKKHGIVERIELEIGELAHVPSGDLLECLHRLVPWQIDAWEKKATGQCACGFSGPPIILERGHDMFMIECPACKGIPDLTAGNEIKVVKVVVH